MKGAILAAGPGEELKPITASIPKPLVRIIDKPLIYYAVQRLLQNGIGDITIVIGPYGDLIRSYFKQEGDLGVELHFIQQKEEGIDGAIKALSPRFRDEEQFILTHSDIIAKDHLLTRTLNAADNAGTEMALAVALQSEIQDFGVVSLDSNGLVNKVIPEGEQKDGNYVVAGTFLLSNKIFKYLDQGYSFNMCFNHFIEDGGEVAGAIWNETWIDVGRPWDILRATRYLLSQLDNSIISSSAEIEAKVEIKGPVIIEEGARILNGTVINGPVYIGKNAFIGNNSLIRDHSAIYDDAKIGMGVEIRSSVIMEEASIARLSYVGASIVCKHATMHSGSITINTNTPPSAITTNIQGEEVTVPLNKFGAVIGENCHIGVHTSLKPGTIVEENIIVEPHQIVNGRITKE